jgi:hypothetical protein
LVYNYNFLVLYSQIHYSGNISLLSAFTGAPAAPPVVRDDVTRIIFSKDIQEPLWTLALVTFLCVQCLCSLIGVVGRRAAFL